MGVGFSERKKLREKKKVVLNLLAQKEVGKAVSVWRNCYLLG